MADYQAPAAPAKAAKKGKGKDKGSDHSGSTSTCDVAKLTRDAKADLACENAFKEKLDFPIQIKVKRPHCGKNKDACSSASDSTCDVFYTHCPATVKFNVNRCFKENLKFPVEFKVKRPKCENKCKKDDKTKSKSKKDKDAKKKDKKDKKDKKKR